MKKKKTKKRQDNQATISQLSKKRPPRFRDIWPTLSEEKRTELFRKTGRNKLQTYFFNSPDWSEIPTHIKSSLADAYQAKLDRQPRESEPFIIPAFIRIGCDRKKLEADYLADAMRVDMRLADEVARERLRKHLKYHGSAGTAADIMNVAEDFGLIVEVLDKEEDGCKPCEFIINIMAGNIFELDLEAFCEAIEERKPVTTSFSIKIPREVIEHSVDERRQDGFTDSLDSLLASPALIGYSAEELRQGIQAVFYAMEQLGEFLQPVFNALGIIFDRRNVGIEELLAEHKPG